MCWRDDVPMLRFCYTCKEQYYGDLGHKGCFGSKFENPIYKKIDLIAKKFGWDIQKTRGNIKRVKEILNIKEEEAIDFLHNATLNPDKDIITQLEEDYQPF